MIWQWPPHHRVHIARHGVRETEAEFVVDKALPPFPREIEDEKQLVWGQTEAGRFLQVIFVYLPDEEVDIAALKPIDRLRFLAGEADVGQVIHARELTAREKKQYRRLRRQ